MRENKNIQFKNSYRDSEMRRYIVITASQMVVGHNHEAATNKFK